jgi:hypothetical protein
MSGGGGEVVAPVWRAGSFVVKTVGGERHVAGWLANDFALDFRAYEDDDCLYGAWHLTHIATGYSVCHFKDADFAATASLVEELRDIADWSFTDPSGAKSAAFAFSEFRDANQPQVRPGSALLSCPAISPETIQFPRTSHATG